ncbi:MAG: RnfABCDGE type electron transport complex subunit B [Synergistaceae bacterium]|nr:RnfABCDGE type electron transport complex subunit B [Synergistaceae bacterium]
MGFFHVAVFPLALMGIMGGVFGVVLAVASVIFHVKQDERINKIRAALPGANCGGCGYPGCDGYASGVVNDGASVNKCSVGGAPVAKKIAEIMGVEAGASVPMRAFLKCKGGCKSSPKPANYDGILDCRSAAVVPSGSPNACPFGCLGFGTCEKVCPFGAIKMGDDGLPLIDVEKCTGCGVCVENCPKFVLTLVPRKADIIVGCSSTWKGAQVRKVCTAGCIGCGMCAKVCPAEAITINKDLAVIDQSKCIDCGRCAAKCPTKCIETRQRSELDNKQEQVA